MSRVLPREQGPSLEALGGHWWRAFDAADTALRAASRVLPAQEFRDRGDRLRREREETIGYLDSLARVEGVPLSFAYLLVSRSNLRPLLGLPSSVSACVFNLDGILIGSAATHVAAWTETFADLIAARVEGTQRRFAPFNLLEPFDASSDYAKHIHGKTRLEGVRAFLASRGISLPEGDPRDRPGTETVHGLANRKNEALLRRLDAQGMGAIRGAKRYLETARDAGIHCAAISASANTDRFSKMPD